MKTLNIFSLISAATAFSFVPAFASGKTASEDLGNVMFVGDSITHGVNAGSYRWELHKIFADNGVLYEGLGYLSGNYSNGVSAGTFYGGISFSNEHSSQASARAYEIAGRSSDGKRFAGTNILNWLGLETETTNNKPYSGKTYAIDTFFMLIGTNDLLSDNTAAGVTDAKVNNLLGADLAGGDMKTILDAMYKSNKNAKVTLLSIPAWTTHPNSNAEKVHADVAAYNVKLGTWIDNYNKANGTAITYVDINAGLVDVASETSFFGNASMFNNPGTTSGKDGLHPNKQGDLIIAGNVAKAMGYAGRTAGQTRKAGTAFAKHFDKFTDVPAGLTATNVTATEDGKLSFSASGESVLKAAWDAVSTLKNGFTVDFGLAFGDGKANGWATKEHMSVTVGDATRYGVLNVNEAYIQWGETVLYSKDMSLNEDLLRVAYVVGNASEGLASGFYVWLNDMLIGEGLSATESSGNSGVTFKYSGSGNVVLESLSLDATGAYAPETTGFTNAEDAYYMTDPNFIPKAAPQGQITFPAYSTFAKSGMTASGNYSARGSANFAGGANTTSRLYVSGGNAAQLYANSGNYTGKLFVEVSGGNASSWYGAHTSGDFNGNVTLRLSGANSGGNTVFGAVNAGTVFGDVYLDLNAEKAVFNSFTQTNPVSLAGAYNAAVTGTLHAQLGAGTFEHDVIGGLHTASGGQSIGKTRIYVNGGTYKGNIYGGGFAGRVGQASAPQNNAGAVSNVTLTGGTINGAVYAGGNGDTINGDTAVSVVGGTILGGIYGGGASGKINGNTHVTIDGNIARLRSSAEAQWINISGGGTGGTISGNSTVTLKNLKPGNLINGADRYAGTISGGTNVTGTKTLTLENVSIKSLDATLSDFDVVNVTRNTSTALSSLGGASVLNMAAGTALSISPKADLKNVKEILLGANAKLELGLAALGKHDEVKIIVADETTAFSILVVDWTSDTDLTGIKFEVGGVVYDAETQIPDLQAGTVFLSYNIPEPSVFGMLAGIGALALAGTRRRRAHGKI